MNIIKLNNQVAKAGIKNAVVGTLAQIEAIEKQEKEAARKEAELRAENMNNMLQHRKSQRGGFFKAVNDMCLAAKDVVSSFIELEGVEEKPFDALEGFSDNNKAIALEIGFMYSEEQYEADKKALSVKDFFAGMSEDEKDDFLFNKRVDALEEQLDAYQQQQEEVYTIPQSVYAQVEADVVRSKFSVIKGGKQDV